MSQKMNSQRYFQTITTEQMVSKDHVYRRILNFFDFSKLRARLGTKNIELLFKYINKELEKKGLVGQCFSFVDSSAIITKTQQAWDGVPSIPSLLSFWRAP